MKAKQKNRVFWIVPLVLIALQTGCGFGGETRTAELSEDGYAEFNYSRGGAPLEVAIKLSETELELTDFLTVVVEARFEEGVLITPPYLSETVYSPLLLVEHPQEETYWSDEEGKMVSRWRYRFEPLRSGSFTLNRFPIGFRLREEKQDNLEQWPVYQIETEPIPYRVKPTEISHLDDIRDIKGMIYPPYRYHVPIITLSCFLAIVLVYLLLKRHGLSRKRSDEESLPVIDTYRESLKRLEELEQKGLISKAEFDLFHTELSSILRDYLESYFGLRAREQTTPEFIQEMVETHRFTLEQRQELERFLHLADLVKFATFQPGSEISEKALHSVRSFIQTTGDPDEI